MPSFAWAIRFRTVSRARRTLGEGDWHMAVGQ